MNVIKLQGTLTKDAWFKSADNYTMAKLTILPAGQEKGAIDVTAWGDLANIVKDAKQGAAIAVTARLANRKRADYKHADAAKAAKDVWTIEVNADAKDGGEVVIGAAVQDEIPF